jgi:hypothetical protein
MFVFSDCKNKGDVHGKFFKSMKQATHRQEVHAFYVARLFSSTIKHKGGENVGRKEKLIKPSQRYNVPRII